MIGAMWWVAGVTGPRLLARLLPLWVGVGFVVSQFWTVIDWRAIRAGFALHPVLVGLVVAAAGALAGRSSLREVLRAAELRAVWRSPIGRWRRGLLVSGPAAAMMSPALAAMLLAPPAVWFSSIPIALLPIAGWRGLLPLLLALVSPALALPATAGSIWLAGDAVVAAIPDDRVGGTVRLPRPRGPVAALVWRDLLAILRAGRGGASLLLLPGVPLAGLLWGIRVNGGLAVGARAQAAGVMFCLVAPVAGAALGELRRALGRDLDSPRLPIGPGSRWVALAGVVAAVMAPTGVALAAVDPLAVASPTAGLAWSALIAGSVLVLTWARPGGRRPYSMGVQIGWCLGVLGLVLWDSALARGLQLLLALLAGFGGHAGLVRARHNQRVGRW